MRFLIAFAIFLLMTACSRADEIATVVLKNDSSYTGKVVVNLATEIALRLPDGTLKSFRRTVIREIIIHQDVSNASIVRADSSANADTSRVNQPITTYSYLKPDSVNADPPDFFCLGTTLFTPVGFNLRGGVNSKSFAVHVSGMDYGSTEGIQVDILFLKTRRNNTESYMGMTIGGLNIHLDKDLGKLPAGDYYWNFVGIVFVVHTGDFLFETGLNVGDGRFENPSYMLQVGYVPKIW